MTIQYPCSYHRSPLPKKCFATVIVLCLLILLVPSGFAAPKRVVVLYFEITVVSITRQAADVSLRAPSVNSLVDAST